MLKIRSTTFIFIVACCLLHASMIRAFTPNNQPYDFKLAEAIKTFPPNSKTLFKKLKQIHQEARQQNIPLTYPATDVNHSGKIIRLTITHDTAEGILLPEHTNFNGWTFEVDADDSAPLSSYLFRFSENVVVNIPTINKSTIDSGHFEHLPQLSTGTKLLILEDRTPWTYRNDTPDTYFPGGQPGTPWQAWDNHDPKYRRDILLLTNGVAKNATIASYNTPATHPYCKYVSVTDKPKSFSNLTLHRVCKSNRVVKLLYACYVNNMTVSNITVNTEPSTAINDACITFVDATNITINNYTIQHTYSRANNWGYGMDMNNVWNTRIVNMHASGPEWGVLGNNNMNTVLLEDCTINRFDVHCYAKDIRCLNCTFRNDNYLKEVRAAGSYNGDFKEKNYHIYNRFSSLYGTLSYDYCLFDGFYPFLTDYAYNIHSACNVIFRNCEMNLYQNKYAYLFNMGFWGAPDNERKEHKERHLPKVEIDQMTFRLHKGIKSVCIFHLMDRFTGARERGRIKQKGYKKASTNINGVTICELDNPSNKLHTTIRITNL